MLKPVSENYVRQGQVILEAVVKQRGWRINTVAPGVCPSCCIETKTLNVSAFGPTLNAEQENMIRANHIHEAGHAVYSELPNAGALVHTIFNAIEDLRIEAALSVEWAGAGPSLQEKNRILHGQRREEMESGKFQGGALLEALMRLMSVDRGIDMGIPKDAKVQKYMDLIAAKFATWKSLPNRMTKEGAKEVGRLAQEIAEMLREEKQKEKEQQKQDKKQGKQEKKDSSKPEESEEGEEGQGESGDKSGEGKESEDSEETGEGSASGDEDDSEDAGEEGSAGSGDEDGDEEGEGSAGTDPSDSDEDGEEEGKDGSASDEDGDDETGKGAGDEEANEDADEEGTSTGDENTTGEEGEDGSSGEASADGDGDEEGSSSDSSDGSDETEDGDEEGDSGNTKPGATDQAGKKDSKTAEQELEEDAMGEDLSAALQKLASEAAQESVDNDPDRYVSDASKDIWTVPSNNDAVFTKSKLQTQVVVGKLQRSLEQALMAEMKSRTIRNMEEGDLDLEALHHICQGTSKAVFSTVTKGKKLNTAVVITLDESGSMGVEKTNATRSLAIALGESLDRLGIPFEIIGASTHGYESLPSGFDRVNPIQYFLYKTFGERWIGTKTRLGTVVARQNNVDGEFILSAGKRLLNRREPRKIVLSLSDGVPDAGHGNSGKMGRNLTNVCKTLRQNGIEVYGFGILTRAPAAFYGAKWFVYAPSIAEMGAQFFRECADIIKGKGTASVTV